MKFINIIVKGALLVALSSVIIRRFKRLDNATSDLIQRLGARLIEQKHVLQLIQQKCISSDILELMRDVNVSHDELYISLAGYAQHRRVTLENSPIDNSGYNSSSDEMFAAVYLQHQLDIQQDIIALLEKAGHMKDINIRNIALQHLPIFKQYLFPLRQLITRHIAADESRIRAFAHQIWEAEGKPEGYAEKHWEMARKLSEALSVAEARLVMEHDELPVSASPKYH